MASKKKLRREIAELADMMTATEALLWRSSYSHGVLSSGVRDVLGLERWPDDMGSGPEFSLKTVALLQNHANELKAKIATYLDDIGYLKLDCEKVDQLRDDIHHVSSSHGNLMRGIKAVIGIKNWPKALPGEPPADQAIRLLQEWANAQVGSVDGCWVGVDEALELVAKEPQQ